MFRELDVMKIRKVAARVRRLESIVITLENGVGFLVAIWYVYKKNNLANRIPLMWITIAHPICAGQCNGATYKVEINSL